MYLDGLTHIATGTGTIGPPRGDEPERELIFAETIETKSERFAKHAVDRIFKQLEVVPVYHSPEQYTMPEPVLRTRDWLVSHSYAIQTLIQAGLETLSTANFHIERYRLDQYNRQRELGMIDYGSGEQAIVYSGIEEIVADAYNNNYDETETRPVEEINQKTVRSIAAQVIRSEYWRQFFETNPDLRNSTEDNPYAAVFDRNVIAAATTASAYEQRHESTPTGSQPADELVLAMS